MQNGIIMKIRIAKSERGCESALRIRFWIFAQQNSAPGYRLWPPAAGTVTAQGIGRARSGPGTGPPQVDRRRDGTPAKPGFFAACRKKMRPNIKESS
jgi:hypothetical protein